MTGLVPFGGDGADPRISRGRLQARCNFISAWCDFKTLGAFFCNVARQVRCRLVNAIEEGREREHREGRAPDGSFRRPKTIGRNRLPDSRVPRE
jgi:hypothetical protein